MSSPDIATTIDFYLEGLTELGLGPKSIAMQVDEINRFLANPPPGIKNPEDHLVQTAIALIDGLPEKKFS